MIVAIKQTAAGLNIPYIIENYHLLHNYYTKKNNMFAELESKNKAIRVIEDEPLEKTFRFTKDKNE